MRKLYRIADMKKQLQSFVHRELSLATILVNARAFDQLHYEVGHAIFGGAPIVQACNVGMIKRRQNLTFVAKAFE